MIDKRDCLEDGKYRMIRVQKELHEYLEAKKETAENPEPGQRAKESFNDVICRLIGLKKRVTVTVFWDFPDHPIMEQEI